MKVLQNTPQLANPSIEPTIKITSNDPEWEIAYPLWISGKNPSDDPKWKLGVFFHIE